MIDQNDLRASISAGIVTEAQAAALMSLAHNRSGARENLAPGDEPFELFKGFNEIFIVIGLVILSMGWLSGVIGFIEPAKGGLITQVILIIGLGAALLWYLSEYFINTRRMVAPAIALSVMWMLNALIGFLTALAEPFMIGQQDYTSLVWPACLTTLTVLVFWWRFRVPFAMAMIALGAFGVALIWAAGSVGKPETLQEIFLLSGDGPFAFLTLLIGLAVFVLAMVFDMSDPYRMTRRAANGFWLHVVAAPALVNTVAMTLLAQESVPSYIMLTLFILLLASVAIIIDRRSFLIAAVGYCVVLTVTLFDGSFWAIGILLLGAALLILGATWERIRARLLALMPGFVPLHRLPPSHIAKASV